MNAPCNPPGPADTRDTRRYGLSDTGPRFALLMTVVVASAVPMLNRVLAPAPDDTPGDALGCLLAAGLDPDGRNLDNMLLHLRNRAALQECMSGAPGVAYWKGMVATLALLAVAAFVYWWQSRWRDRWRRTVPVEAMDGDGTLTTAIRGLCERAGITFGVRFRVDPARTTAGAVVYGRPGQYTVCLHSGLLVRRATDPDGFDAVVLHELAHIRNRDVDYAAASTALWRVFVLLALVPYLFFEGGLLLDGLLGWTDSPFWPGAASGIGYSLLSGLVLVGLVHLARADLLRHRELHADARAVASGALPTAWHHRDPDGTVATSLRQLTPLLRTHPTWAERRGALAAPARLSGASALSMFLVGVSGSLLVNELVVVPGLGGNGGTAWCTAAFVAPVLCVSLARSVAAAHASGQAESGVRAGLWLGCGLILGEFVRGMPVGNAWLVPAPAFLLGLLFAAAVPAVWSAQCARLALGFTGRRSRLAAGLLNLLVTLVVLWGGLHWWQQTGKLHAVGVFSQVEAFRDFVTQASPGRWQDYAWELSAITATFPTLTALNASVLLALATLALWVFPLGLHVWTGGPELRVRRTLAAGLAGGVLCWVGFAAVWYAQHARRPATYEERGGAYGFVHAWFAATTVTLACVLTAAVVAALSRRYWLPRALLAAAVAQLLGYAGSFVLLSADGCLGPFRAMANECHWVPEAGWGITQTVVGITLSTTILLAACAALGGAGARWVVRRLGRRPAPVLPTVPTTDPRQAQHTDRRQALAAPLRSARRRPNLLPLAAVLALSIPALAFTAVEHSHVDGRQSSSAGEPGAPVDRIGELVDAPPTARAAKIREWQAGAWLDHGGLARHQRIGEAFGDLSDALLAASEQKPDKNGMVKLDDTQLRHLCGALAERADEALDYFPVPDQSLQKGWSEALHAIARSGRACRDAMTPGNDEKYRTDTDRWRAFQRALGTWGKASDTLTNTMKDITEMATEPGPKHQGD